MSKPRPPIWFLSLIQPWASLLVEGHKKIETRGWRFIPRYRGIVAVHASKAKPDATCCSTTDALDDLRMASPAHLIRGAVLGVVNLFESRKFNRIEADIDERERQYGDFAPGRVGLWCNFPWALPEPIPCNGRVGFYRAPAAIEAAIWKQIPDYGADPAIASRCDTS